MNAVKSDTFQTVPTNSDVFRQSLSRVASIEELLSANSSSYCILNAAKKLSDPYKLLLNTRDGAWVDGLREVRQYPELALTCLSNGFVDRATVMGWNKLDGGVYTQDGNLCPDFRVRTGHCGPLTVSKDRIDAAKMISGTHLYLGQLNNVYGHFILETLGRCWALGYLPNFQGNFIFQRIRKTGFSENDTFGKLLHAAGIDLSRVHIVDEDTRFERLIVPTAGLDLGKSVHDEQIRFYRSISKNLETFENAKKNRLGWFDFLKKKKPSTKTKRLYLSRKKLALGMHKFLNEQAIENTFKRWGFDIIFPETLTIEEQLTLFSGAEMIAGANSSALHNSVFAPEGCKIIMLDGRTGVHGQADWVQVSLCHAYKQQLSILECDTALFINGISRGRLPYLCDLQKLARFLETTCGAPKMLIENKDDDAGDKDQLSADALITLGFWLARKNAFTLAKEAQQIASILNPKAESLGRLKRVLHYRSWRNDEENPPKVTLMPDVNDMPLNAIDEPQIALLKQGMGPFTSEQ